MTCAEYVHCYQVKCTVGGLSEAVSHTVGCVAIIAVRLMHLYLAISLCCRALPFSWAIGLSEEPMFVTVDLIGMHNTTVPLCKTTLSLQHYIIIAQHYIIIT